MSASDWNSFVDKAFYAVITGAVIFAVHFLSGMAESINTLNTRVAVVIEKVGDQDIRLKKLERLGKTDDRCPRNRGS